MTPLGPLVRIGRAAGRVGRGLGPAAVAAVATLATLATSEALCWWAARDAGGPQPGERAAVVVLGLPGSNAVLRAMQRWRVDLGRRALADHDAVLVVLSGGPTVSERSEAAQLAEWACRAGVDPGLLVLEEASRTTIENVQRCRPLVAGCDAVVLASHVLHARRARTIWYGMAAEGDRPRLVLADRYRPLDRPLLRTPGTFAELLYRAQARRGPRPPATDVWWSRLLYRSGPVLRRRSARHARRGGAPSA